MKAPEKIYLCPSDRANGEYEDEWLYNPWGEGCVKYIRKDVFIEKAEKYLTEKFINDVSVLAGGAVHINFDSAISNFIKYMKGE